MTKDHAYPAMKWHPKTGETRVFNAASDVPDGWIDTHPDNVKNVTESTADTAGSPEAKARAEKSAFPAMLWHPETGESRVFHKAGDVPEGWLDTHPDNVKNLPKAEKAAQTKPVPLSMTRKEMVQALQDGGISFDPASKVDVLYAILTEAVKKFLTDAEVEFDPATDTKALLELLPKPE